MSQQHTHSWKKYKGDTYYCTWPTCYRKYDIKFLQGKLAKCHECERDFLIIEGFFDKENLWLNCPNCKDKENPLTIDGAKRLMQNLIKESVKEAIHFKILKLNQRAKDLQSKEAQLGKKFKEVTEIYEKAQRLSAKTELQRKHIVEMFKLKKAKLNGKIVKTDKFEVGSY